MNFKMSFLFLETFKKEKKKEKKKKRKLKHPPLRIDKRQLRSPFDFIISQREDWYTTALRVAERPGSIEYPSLNGRYSDRTWPVIEFFAPIRWPTLRCLPLLPQEISNYRRLEFIILSENTRQEILERPLIAIIRYPFRGSRCASLPPSSSRIRKHHPMHKHRSTGEIRDERIKSNGVGIGLSRKHSFVFIQETHGIYRFNLRRTEFS